MRGLFEENDRKRQEFMDQIRHRPQFH